MNESAFAQIRSCSSVLFGLSSPRHIRLLCQCLGTPIDVMHALQISHYIITQSRIAHPTHGLSQTPIQCFQQYWYTNLSRNCTDLPAAQFLFGLLSAMSFMTEEISGMMNQSIAANDYEPVQSPQSQAPSQHQSQPPMQPSPQPPMQPPPPPQIQQTLQIPQPQEKAKPENPPAQQVRGIFDPSQYANSVSSMSTGYATIFQRDRGGFNGAHQTQAAQNDAYPVSSAEMRSNASSPGHQIESNHNIAAPGAPQGNIQERSQNLLSTLVANQPAASAQRFIPTNILDSLPQNAPAGSVTSNTDQSYSAPFHPNSTSSSTNVSPPSFANIPYLPPPRLQRRQILPSAFGSNIEPSGMPPASMNSMFPTSITNTPPGLISFPPPPQSMLGPNTQGPLMANQGVVSQTLVTPFPSLRDHPTKIQIQVPEDKSPNPSQSNATSSQTTKPTLRPGASPSNDSQNTNPAAAYFDVAMSALKANTAVDVVVPPASIKPPPLYEPASLTIAPQAVTSTQNTSQSNAPPAETSSNVQTQGQPNKQETTLSTADIVLGTMATRSSRREFDWCGEFQLVSDAFQTARFWNDYEGEKGMLLANAAADLSQLAQDFVVAARTYGTVIINEYFLPMDAKTIKPVSLGGIAGGDKYLVPSSNILFKLATDRHGIYGGLENAQKAANHELRSLIAIYNSAVQGIHVPLMAIINHRGLRLIAETLVPVRGSESLHYGSCDQGRTVRAEIPDLNEKMEQLGRSLNLKAYNYKGKVMHLCTDIEAHKGLDGRYYLLDFARVFPPCFAPRGPSSNPSDRSRPAHAGSTHMYALLRPSYVRSYPTPLCSEGLSQMQDPSDITRHSDGLLKATMHLFESRIPKMAEELESLSEDTPSKYPLNFNLAEQMHRRGINIHMLGLLFQNCRTEVWKNIVVYEMIARITKANARRQMRSQMELHGRMSDVAARSTFANVLTLALFNHKAVRSATFDQRTRYRKEVDESTDFWENVLPNEMMTKYLLLKSGKLVEGEKRFWVKVCRDISNKLDRPKLFSRVVQMLEVVLTESCIERRFTQNEYTTPFHATEIAELPAQISHMNLVTQASGVMLLAQALQMKGPTCLLTLNMAIQKLEEACPYFQYSHSMLFDLASAYYALGIRETGEVAKKNLEDAISKLEEANHLQENHAPYVESLIGCQKAKSHVNWKHAGTLQGHEASVESLIPLPGKRILSGSRDGTMRIWSVDTLKEEHQWKAYDVPIWNMQLMPAQGDGLGTGLPRIATTSGSTDRPTSRVKLWGIPAEDAWTGDTDPLLTYVELSKSPVVRALTPWDESQVYCGDETGKVSVVDFERGQVIQEWTAHQSTVSALQRAGIDHERYQHQLLLSTSRDQHIRGWDMRTAAKEKSAVWSLSFSDSIHYMKMQDGHTALLGLNCGDLAWVDIRNTSKPLHRRTIHIGAVLSFCLHPTLNYVATVSSDHSVRLVDLESRRCTKVISHHADTVWSVAWMPELGMWTTGSRDKTIALFKNID